jgi:hypothetical protein
MYLLRVIRHNKVNTRGICQRTINGNIHSDEHSGPNHLDLVAAIAKSVRICLVFF